MFKVLPKTHTAHVRNKSCISYDKLNIFVRQGITESGVEQGKKVQGVIDTIKTLDNKPIPINFVVGDKALSGDTFKKEFEKMFDRPWTPQNYRDARIKLLGRSDGMVVIRSGSSESTAFEVAYNVFAGNQIPMFFAVDQEYPIKTTLLKDLDDLCEVEYHTFKDPAELRDPLERYLVRLAKRKGFVLGEYIPQ